jgi:hypothetical protein
MKDRLSLVALVRPKDGAELSQVPEQVLRPCFATHRWALVTTPPLGMSEDPRHQPTSGLVHNG